MCIITWKWDEMNSNHNGPRTLAVTSHYILAGSHCLGACALVCTLSQISGQSTSSTASKPPLSPQAPPTPTNTTTRQSSTTLLQSTICSRLCTTHEPSHPPKMHRELVSLREKEKEGARESEHISERAASWAACHWSSASSALRTVARAASLVRRAQSNITSALWCIVQSKEVHRLPFRRPTYCRSLHTNISNECWNSVYVFRNQEARSLVPDV